MYDIKFKLGTTQKLKTGQKVLITRILVAREMGQDIIYYYNHMNNIKYTADKFVDTADITGDGKVDKEDISKAGEVLNLGKYGKSKKVRN
jgi:hypothetical protein